GIVSDGIIVVNTFNVPHCTIVISSKATATRVGRR
ncbi:unnamed protein product, partial [Rotaria sp. Silwood2]